VTTPANRAQNGALLRALRTDVASSLAALRPDARSLFGRCAALARRVATAGQALESRPGDARLRARLAAAVPALQAAATAAGAEFAAGLAGIRIGPEASALLTANPSSDALASSVQAALFNAAGATATLTNAATEFQGSIAALLASAAAVPTRPQLVGPYAGTARETSGPDAGARFTLVVTFTSQSEAGDVTGTVTLSAAGRPDETRTLFGTVTEAGVFEAALVASTPEEVVILRGRVLGDTITGTYATFDGGGRFTIRRP
jgi:hypothetical protein